MALASDAKDGAARARKARDERAQLDDHAHGLRLAIKQAEEDLLAEQAATKLHLLRGANAEIAALVTQYNERLPALWDRAAKLAEDAKAVEALWQEVRRLRREHGQPGSPPGGAFTAWSQRYLAAPVDSAIRASLFRVIDGIDRPDHNARMLKTWLSRFTMPPAVAEKLRIPEPDDDDAPLSTTEAA